MIVEVRPVAANTVEVHVDGVLKGTVAELFQGGVHSASLVDGSVLTRQVGLSKTVAAIVATVAHVPVSVESLDAALALPVGAVVRTARGILLSRSASDSEPFVSLSDPVGDVWFEFDDDDLPLLTVGGVL